MLQKNPEHEPVRDQQQRHNQSRNEVGGSQLPRRESSGIRLLEGVHEIDRAPDIEDPREENTGPASKEQQRQHRQCRRNDVPSGRGRGERPRQVRGHDACDEEHLRRLRIFGQQDKLRADRSKGRETWA